MATNSKKNNYYYYAVYICALLSCLVPRYIDALKIHIGLNISPYTFAVLFVWMIYVRRIRVFDKVESYLFIIWFLFIIGAIWRAQKLGVWAYYCDWVITAICFQQILLAKRDERTFECVLRAAADGLFIQLLLGLYEILTHRYLFEIGNTKPEDYGRVPITMFHNLNDYATFVTTLLPFALYCLFSRGGIIRKSYYCAASLLALFLIYRSGSRAAYLAVAAMLVCACFIFSRHIPMIKNIFFGFAVVGISGLFLNPSIQTQILHLFRKLFLDGTTFSNSARINLIKNGFHFLEQTRGFGVGAGNLYKWLDERSIYFIGELNYLHNWYLEILVTFGCLFFVLYMFFHLKLLWRFFTISGHENRCWTRNNTLLISLVGFSVVSISSSSNVYSEWVWMYLVFLGVNCLTGEPKREAAFDGRCVAHSTQ